MSIYFYKILIVSLKRCTFILLEQDFEEEVCLHFRKARIISSNEYGTEL